MAYKKTTWVDNETPINAENLNKMEEGIVEASKTGGILEGTIVAYDGDTIPEGYEEVEDVKDYEIANLPSKSGGTNKYILRKHGKIVALNVGTIWADAFTGNSWNKLGDIPSELIPKSDATTIGVITNGDTGNSTGYAKVEVRSADGLVQCKPNVSEGSGTTLAGICFSVSWILD